MKFHRTNKWYLNKWEVVLKNEMDKIVSEYKMKTDQAIQAIRQD